MTWKNETTRQPLPAPLPMYEPVRLKHVPTFVRRRYDRDINNKLDYANEGLSSEEGKRDGDGVEDNDSTLVSDEVASIDTEEDFGTIGSHQQEIKIVDDGIVASWYENGSVQDQVLGDEHGNFDKQQGLPKEDDKSKDDGTQDVIHDATGPEMDDSVDYEAEDDDAQEYSDTNSLEETKYEGEIQHKDGASSVEDSVVEDTIMDHKHENSDIYDQDFEEEDGANNEVKFAYVVSNEDQHNENGLYMEDCKTEDYGTMNEHYVIEFKDIERGNFDDKQELRVEDCKRVEDGAKDVIVASNYMDETVKLEEIIEKQHENLDIKQGIYQPCSLASTPWLARRLIQIEWDPSPINFHKLNLDALSKVGIVIRDSHSAILSAQVYKIMGPITISPVVAEAWALRNGLLQANKLGHTDRSHIRMIFRDYYYQCPWNLQFLSTFIPSYIVQ